MFQRLLALCLLAITATSCGPRYCDYYPYHEDGRAKPIMAILKIQDKSDSGLCWDVAKEIDQTLHYRLMDDGSLYLIPQEVIDRNDNPSENYFSKDLCFAKQYGKCEFVVAMELIEHKWVPYQMGKITPIYPIHNRQCNEVLTMKMRLRIIDVRCETPKIVLQEIVQSNHMMPRDQDNLDYTSYRWGVDAYNRTPLALAHQRMAYDVAARIENICNGAR